MDRAIVFTNEDNITFKAILNLPEAKGAPVPWFITYHGKLYKHTGSGIAAHFYREITNFHAAQDRDVGGRVEFPALNGKTINGD